MSSTVMVRKICQIICRWWIEVRDPCKKIMTKRRGRLMRSMVHKGQVDDGELCQGNPWNSNQGHIIDLIILREIVDGKEWIERNGLNGLFKPATSLDSRMDHCHSKRHGSCQEKSTCLIELIEVSGQRQSYQQRPRNI